MELRQLAYLIAVIEEANFTRAAERLHVAQPGVSAQIRALERELGATLLDRSRRSVTLTEVGATVLPYARAALAAVDGAREATEELTGLLRGHLTIGTLTSISSHGLDLPALLSGFSRAHPAVEISLAVADSAQLADAVRTGRYDLAVLGLGAATPPGLAVEVITSEPLVAVVASHDPLAEHASITLAALTERSLITLPVGSGLRGCINEATATIGSHPQVTFEAGDPRLVADLAAHGLGVGLVPRSLAELRGPGLHTLTITHPTMTGRIALAWRAEGPTNPATRHFITHLRTDAAPAE